LEERATGHESTRTQRERIVELEGLLATHLSQAKDAEDRMVKLELDLKSSQAAEGELVERVRIAEERATHHESSLEQVTDRSLELEDLLSTHQNQVTIRLSGSCCDGNRKVPCQSECRSFGIKGEVSADGLAN
jgi:chromosome segregation ATPase